MAGASVQETRMVLLAREVSPTTDLYMRHTCTGGPAHAHLTRTHVRACTRWAILYSTAAEENFDEVGSTVVLGGSFQKAIVVGGSGLRAGAVGNFAR